MVGTAWGAWDAICNLDLGVIFTVYIGWIRILVPVFMPQYIFIPHLFFFWALIALANPTQWLFRYSESRSSRRF